MFPLFRVVVKFSNCLLIHYALLREPCCCRDRVNTKDSLPTCIVKAALTTGHTKGRHKLLGPQMFWWFGLISLFATVKINSKIALWCAWYDKLKKHHEIHSKYHSRRVSMWVMKLVNYVHFNFFLPISSLSALSFRTRERSMMPVNPKAQNR